MNEAASSYAENDESDQADKNINTSSSHCNERKFEVKDLESENLQQLSEHFWNKPFLKFPAQSFEQYPLINAYDDEEKSFLKTVKICSRENVP